MKKLFKLWGLYEFRYRGKTIFFVQKLSFFPPIMKKVNSFNIDRISILYRHLHELDHCDHSEINFKISEKFGTGPNRDVIG